MLFSLYSFRLTLIAKISSNPYENEKASLSQYYESQT